MPAMSSSARSTTKTCPRNCLPFSFVLQQVCWQKNFIVLKNYWVCPEFPKTDPKKAIRNSALWNKSGKWWTWSEKLGYCVSSPKIHHPNRTFHLWRRHHPPSPPSSSSYQSFPKLAIWKSLPRVKTKLKFAFKRKWSTEIHQDSPPTSNCSDLGTDK